MKYAHGRGFTLIEMMIVVAILGILATLAYPSYRDYILRGRIPEGLAALANGQVAMANFITDNRVYSGVPPDAPVGTPAVNACTTLFPVTTQYFSVACDPASPVTATTYRLLATGLGSMAGFSYTIDQAGNQRSTITEHGWKKSHSPDNCWVQKKDGSC